MKCLVSHSHHEREEENYNNKRNGSNFLMVCFVGIIYHQFFHRWDLKLIFKVLNLHSEALFIEYAKDF